MSNEFRQMANIIPWTNNLTAGSGTVAKGDLVHIGCGKFGVAVDAIAFGATGQLMINGYFEAGSAIINETVKIGQTLVNNEADIKTVAQLKKQVQATAGTTINESNLFLMQDITASGTAQSFKYVLK